jgi:argininosuccinate synthase
VKLKLYKGNVIVAGRKSPMSIYDQALASFGSEGSYDHSDADGFLKLFAIPTAAEARQRIAEEKYHASRAVEPSRAGILEHSIAG